MIVRVTLLGAVTPCEFAASPFTVTIFLESVSTLSSKAMYLCTPPYASCLACRNYERFFLYTMAVLLVAMQILSQSFLRSTCCRELPLQTFARSLQLSLQLTETE